jgi:hypothetical protein
MATAFSAITQQKVASPNTTNTFSHTVSGSNTILFVACSNENAGAVTGATYNGVSMTEIGSGNGTLHLFYLINPTTGANNVTITRSGTANDFHGWAISYTGVKQSGQPDASTTATAASAASLTTTLTVVANNSWAILVGRTDNAGMAASTNCILRSSPDAYNAWALFDTNSAKASGSLSMVFNGASPSNLTSVMASFAPSVTNNGAGFLSLL